MVYRAVTFTGSFGLLSGVLFGLAVFTVQPAFAATLTYQAENKWVAAEDNAPLLQLMQAARNGQTRFLASLPTENRALAIQRLLIVRDILAREAGRPILLEESAPARQPNTLIIQ